MTQAPISSQRTRPILWLCGVVFAIWVAFLIAETLLTANPIIVSRPQILMAPIVVEGRPKWDEKLVEVQAVTKGAKPDAVVIHVENLDLASRIRESETYFFPLAQTSSGSYRLVSVPMDEMTTSRSQLYSVYPVLNATRTQVSQILSEGQP